jgi:hypothetical protein
MIHSLSSAFFFSLLAWSLSISCFLPSPLARSIFSIFYFPSLSFGTIYSLGLLFSPSPLALSNLSPELEFLNILKLQLDR